MEAELIIEPPAVPMMDRVCGWCDKPMGQKPGTPGQVTHGMCPECKAVWDAQIERYRQLNNRKDKRSEKRALPCLRRYDAHL
jgi:hypothetical protein